MLFCCEFPAATGKIEEIIKWIVVSRLERFAPCRSVHRRGNLLKAYSGWINLILLYVLFAKSLTQIALHFHNFKTDDVSHVLSEVSV